VFYSIYVDTRFYGDEAALFANPPMTVNDDWPRPKDPGTANGSAKRALMMIDGLLRTCERYPERMTACTSSAELRAAVKAGRHAALMGIEGGHAIEGDLGLLRLFHKLGVRYMTLTHTLHNEFADSCAPAEPRWGGLNTLGVKVVQEMNRLGVMVDVSHVSDATFFDTLRVTRTPVICSHSSMRALCGHKRNITDDMLRALAANGGVVMINYNCGFLDEDYGKNASGRDATRRIQEKSAREKFAEGSPELQNALAKLDERFPPVARPP
jgi:membrane dipeptidase